MFKRDDALVFEGETFLYYANAARSYYRIIRKLVGFGPPPEKYAKHVDFLTCHGGYVFLVVHEDHIKSPDLTNNRSASYLLEEE